YEPCGHGTYRPPADAVALWAADVRGYYCRHSAPRGCRRPVAGLPLGGHSVGPAVGSGLCPVSAPLCTRAGSPAPRWPSRLKARDMHISLFTDYALRVLMYLALNPTQQVTIREIADSYGISKNHLMKVVQDLNNKGYLKATRGKNGGLRLRGEPEAINLGT